jgi:cytochrome c oxidase subunit 4
MSKDSQSHHHILPLKTYINVGLALLVLTAVTVAVSRVHLGPFNMVVAMLIAGSKAMLVALYFMHLKYDNKLFLSIFIAGILFLVLFIVFTMFDTERRGDIEAFKADPIQSAAAMYDTSAAPADTLTIDTAMTADTAATDTTAPPASDTGTP